jgi:hypothetical protein
MKKFEIIGILAAAETFSREEGATKELEKILRDTESEKQSISPEAVTITEEESLYTAFSTLVAHHCVPQMVAAVINKYTELGHALVE